MKSKPYVLERRYLTKKEEIKEYKLEHKTLNKRIEFYVMSFDSIILSCLSALGAFSFLALLGTRPLLALFMGVLFGVATQWELGTWVNYIHRAKVKELEEENEQHS